MQEALPGKRVLDLTPEPGRDTEVEEDGIAVHGFWEPDELLFYVAATEVRIDNGAHLCANACNLLQAQRVNLIRRRLDGGERPDNGDRTGQVGPGSAGELPQRGPFATAPCAGDPHR